MSDLITVRIPELNEHALPVNADRIPVWSSEDNKTRYATLQTLREFIETGDTSTVPITIDGGSILYIVPASADGGDTINLPQIAGKNFRLKRDGFPLQRDIEFEVRSAGGAKLLTSTLIEGQRYEFELYEYMIGVAPASGDSDSGGNFIKGNDTINTNLNLTPAHLNKILQIRGGSNKLTISLPDVELCPDDSVIMLETTITNTYQHLINTSGGQYIYIQGQSVQSLYIGKGEYIWLYRKDDGWYAIAFNGNFINVAMPKAAYKVGFNQLLLDGSLVERANYPRLWAAIQSFGSSLVTDAVWNTASATVAGRTVQRPYRGCFSHGNGTTTFRLPDLMNMSLRGVKNVGGSDTERHLNAPGGYQRHEFESHDHDMTFTELPNGASGNPGYDGGSNQYDQNEEKTTTAAGGTETRMDNIGVLWVIDY